MNIRVDLNIPIKDGTEVVFRSPVDCSQVTGLKVYYPGASKEFMLADAHGNNVGNIDHLFGENVAVKVILDVTAGMAFVQNADTNAYLERRFEELGKGGGVAPLIVTLKSGQASHTALQIHEHAEAGGDVWFEEHGTRIALTKHTPKFAEFSTIGINRSVQAFEVYDDGTYDYLEDTLALADEAAKIDDTTVGTDAWSSKKTVDTMCLSFTESGSAVRCEPVEGYPLNVVASEEATKITRCGKNIFDIATAGVYHCNAVQPNMDMYVTETGLRLEPLGDFTNNWTVWGFYLGTAKELAGKTITVSGNVATSITDVDLPWVQIGALNVEPTAVREKPRYSNGGYAGNRKTLVSGGKHSGHATATYTVTGEEENPYIAILFYLTYGGAGGVEDWTEWSNIQVEIGDKATSYEPYEGETFAPGEPITALKGVNSLYADSGKITVSGKVDSAEILKAAKNSQKTYELIEDITLAEDATVFERTTDTEGNPFNLSAVAIFMDTPAYAEAASSDYVIFNLMKANNDHLYYYEHTGAILTGARKTTFKAWNDRGLAESYSMTMGSRSGAMYSEQGFTSPLWENVAKVRLSVPSKVIPAGTRIRIYAIRG